MQDPADDKIYNFKELHEVSAEDRREIYEYALTRSAELVGRALSSDDEIRSWWEEQLANIDLAELFQEMFGVSDGER